MSLRTIPEKPTDARWTDSQWEAIQAEGSNILVSAAAGSGKTAVLVERVIRKITQAEEPVDVDRLLIVTFTNAAAAEMKTRVGKALEEKLKADPSNLHIRRQLALLNRASISTLHSFCMNVIRTYYYLVDVDPQFRIMDQNEGAMIQEELLEELLEENYAAENNDDFVLLADRLNKDRSDDSLREAVLRLFKYSRAHADPAEWLQEVADQYHTDGSRSIEELPWGREMMQQAETSLAGAVLKYENAIAAAGQPDGPKANLELLQEELDTCRRALEAKTWKDMQQTLAGFTFKKLASKKEADAAPERREQIRNNRDGAKKVIQKLQEEMVAENQEDALSDIAALYPSVRELCRLVQAFSERYYEVKQKRAMMDFSDLEHTCLQILAFEEASDHYRGFFQEVLVDEYQDTNFVQEKIVTQLSSGNNLFMVGDVKQSIYRFRLAEPDLFLEKFQRYGKSDDGERIMLDKNFRSRRQVLDAVNYLFRQLMDNDLGGIAYDSEAELKWGNDQYPDLGDMVTEVAVIDQEDVAENDPQAAELTNARAEARWIAQAVSDSMQNGWVTDQETGEKRRPVYRDHVILMRSMPWVNEMMEEMQAYGIPVYAEVSGGYFQAVEIQIMISLLQIIDNPLQDIPLASVLRSPIIGWDEEMLAAVRLEDKDASFYQCVELAAAGSSSMHPQAQAFLEQLEGWRSRSKYEPLSEFIWALLEETGYLDFCSGLHGGKQRRANLLALYDRARVYESTSFRGVFRFLRFIEGMKNRKEDLGTARALGEQEDVVRFMSIHKSKGLEFPIVYAAGLQKGFNVQDQRQPLLFHKELGIGMKYVDPTQRVSWPTLPHAAIKNRMKTEALAEELRVLYVAFTRAEEQLILVSSMQKVEKKFEEWEQKSAQAGSTLELHDRLEAQHAFDWLMPVLLQHAEVDPLEQQTSKNVADHSSWRVHIVPASTLQIGSGQEEAAAQDWLQAVKDKEEVPAGEEWDEEVRRRMYWRYPYKEDTRHAAKISVSEWKRRSEDPQAEQRHAATFTSSYARRPSFMMEEAVSPAEKGTVLHIVMEQLSFTGIPDEERVERLLRRLTDDEYITGAQAASVDTAAVTAFFETELGRRVLAAKTVQKEVPITAGVTGDGLENRQLLQGIADLVIQEADGRWVLIDYKTDRVQSRFPGNPKQQQEFLRESYQTQLDLYRASLESIWGTAIPEAYIFAFDGMQTIPMNGR
ncbi:helicase-exonuclease AddAB subunit AddA [uncultured Marinococcus sp.]|uniref:helicase-exonuclease AddAB subunit AddA n=1 Tax=uncultured Marinococcus sp. TaxID=487012 RepID=UPI002615DF7D|nr:helicase-exonuclease AddAB subunit AddA [uncultured Marinococcus sp.]